MKKNRALFVLLAAIIVPLLLIYLFSQSSLERSRKFLPPKEAQVASAASDNSRPVSNKVDYKSTASTASSKCLKIASSAAESYAQVMKIPSLRPLGTVSEIQNVENSSPVGYIIPLIDTDTGLVRALNTCVVDEESGEMVPYDVSMLEEPAEKYPRLNRDEIRVLARKGGFAVRDDSGRLVAYTRLQLSTPIYELILEDGKKVFFDAMSGQQVVWE